MDNVYNKEFYEKCCGDNYDDVESWTAFFGLVAQKIVDVFAPKTVLDAGCAYGYLVKALRDLGVEAYGFDVSEFAISQAHEDIKPFVAVHSITEKLPDTFPDKFDLVITIEVLEHLFPADGSKAIANLCRYSDTVIFTSTPSDLNNRTHVNVQQAEYWAKEFAKNSFFRDLFCSVDFICPWAMVFKKSDSIEDVIFHYEINRRVDKIQTNKTVEYNGKVYFDIGGITEENTSVFSFSENTIKTGKISVPNGCIGIRFDPVENYGCAITDLLIGSNNGILAVRSGNYDYETSGDYFFAPPDPQFYISIPQGTLWVEINCSIYVFDDLLEQKMLLDFQAVINAKDQEYNALVEKSEGELAERKRELEGQKRESEELKKELEERTITHNYEVEALNEDIENLSSELQQYKEHYYAAITQRNDFMKQATDWQNSYNTIRNSQFWKITFPARKMFDGIKWLLKKNKVTRLFCKGLLSLKRVGIKQTWKKVKGKLSPNSKIKYIAASYNISKEERRAEENTKFDRRIKISVLVPLYNTPINFLQEMIASVVAQTYSDWELCLADGSDDKHKDVGKFVGKIAAKDQRIRYKKLEKNLGISENTNACIAMASGDYIALFDHDDVLHPSAFFEVMKAICEKNADFVYTDEATFESPNLNKIITAHFKPDFAPDNLRANNYICHLSVFERALLDKVGGFRKEYDGSQDHDMLLRLTSAAKNVVHIPKILYYWRSHAMSVAMDIGSKSYAVDAGKRAVHDYIASTGYEVKVESSIACPTIYKFDYEIKKCDKVSIIIPNKDHFADLKKCVNSILYKTTYVNYEIVIVDNGSSDKMLFEYYDKLRSDERFTICSLDIEFNYSGLNNYAATFASGKYYILLNNDIEIITPDWIEQMLMYCQRDDVAAVGAKLYYPNNKIQHAGIVLKLGEDRVAGHAFYNCLRTDIGYMGKLWYAQDVSAVTAACMMVKSEVYNEVGGLDENLKVAYNDVDLCMKIRKAGYLIVWTPYAEAYHHESKSRGTDVSLEKQQRFLNEVEMFRKKWADELDAGDPYYNPNLSLDKSDYSLE